MYLPFPEDVAIYTNALSDIYAPPSSSVSVCRIWMSSCCRPSYTAWLISRGNSNELYLSPKTSWNTRWDHFCIDDISDIVFLFLFFPYELEWLPVSFYQVELFLFFFWFSFSFWSLDEPFIKIYISTPLQFITSTLRVFLSMLYRDMQYLQKKEKKKKKDYNLKNQCAKSNNAV